MVPPAKKICYFLSFVNMRFHENAKGEKITIDLSHYSSLHSR